MTPFFAFLHHLAAFTLVAALAVEFVLLRGELTLRTARKLQLVDMVFGVSAGIVLVIGLLRVFYFEKGASYYFHSAPFIAKLSLFVMVGLLSIYPTVEFLSWGKSLKQGQMPALTDRKIAWRQAYDAQMRASVRPLKLAAELEHTRRGPKPRRRRGKGQSSGLKSARPRDTQN